MKENPELYELAYPIYLPWSCRIWTIKSADTLLKDEEKYVVLSVNRSPNPGVLPSISLKPDNGTSSNLSTATSPDDTL